MLNIVLFSLLQPAKRLESRLFTEMVKQGNKEGLRNIVRNEYPRIAWGKYFRKLTSTEQEWALTIIARLD